MVLALPELLALLDLRVFVAATEQIRLGRRISRDVRERGRHRDSVLAQLERHTRPMHEIHVAPSQARAHLVVSGEADLAHAVQQVVAALRPLLAAESLR